MVFFAKRGTIAYEAEMQTIVFFFGPDMVVPP